MDANTVKLANWNGVFMDIEDVKVSVLDRAFLFGDAVYEVIRVYGGRCWNLPEHLDRLQQSLYHIDIAGVNVDDLHSRVQETVNKSGLQDALIYIQITRGVAPRMHRFPENILPNQLVWVQEFNDPYAALREQGAKVATMADIRWKRNDIKCTSLMANCLSATAAYNYGCDEALLINAEGYVTEGSHTSMFGVADGKILIAPGSADVLPGITKKMIINLSGALAIPLVEHRLTENELPQLQELFMTGTPEEIVPITTVDNFAIGDGRPGAVAISLQKAFRQAIQTWLKGVD